MGKRQIKFKLGACDWVIDYSGSVKNQIGGVCDVINKEITLPTKFGNTDLPEEFIEETALHEVVHAILDHIGSDKAGDEVFVQSFAASMNQYLKTKR